MSINLAGPVKLQIIIWKGLHRNITQLHFSFSEPLEAYMHAAYLSLHAKTHMHAHMNAGMYIQV